RRFQHEVEVGMVGVNVPIPVPVGYYSFGGWKNSLFGDTHAYGPDAMHFFTRTKVVTSRWLDPSHGGVDLGFPKNDGLPEVAPAAQARREPPHRRGSAGGSHRPGSGAGPQMSRLGAEPAPSGVRRDPSAA